MKHCCQIPTWREHRTGAKPSPGPRPLPRSNSSYHPDSPRRHESQLSTALVLCLRYVLFRVPSLDCTLFNCEHIVSNITFTFPFSAHRSAGWAGKKDSPTMRRHSSKQIDVHTAAATCISFTTSHTPTITSLSPSHHQWKAVRSGQPK